MSFQNSSEIQKLLDAEREAQKIVQKARTDRTQRVKDARAEARKEIENYKQQKEREFKKFEAEYTGRNAELEAKAERDVEGKLNEIKVAGEKFGEKVVADLIKVVTEIKPEPHRNLVSNAA